MEENTMNKRKYCFVLICTLLSSLCFSVERGLIFTENLRIRDLPSTNGKVVGTCIRDVVIEQNGTRNVLYENKIINIYEKSGSQTMQNGFFDYWYKISETENYWINAYYVAFFPIYFRPVPGYDTKNYKIMNIDENGLAHYFIIDVYNPQNTIEKSDYTLYDELYEEMQDNGNLRLSECIKDVNEKLALHEQNLSVGRQSPNTFRLDTVPLWYNVKTAGNLAALKEILGGCNINRSAVYFTAVDLDYEYSLFLMVGYDPEAPMTDTERRIFEMEYYVVKKE
jgi:hypothetical protein